MPMKWTGSILIASILGLIALVRIAAAHPFIVDQSNELSRMAGTFLNLAHPSNLPIGQEFTPTLAALDVVELFLEGPPTAPEANVVVHVRKGTITAPILGTSAVVSLPAVPGVETLNGVFHFDFASSVALIPGDLYVIEVELSGGPWFIESGVEPGSSDYLGGRLIVAGMPLPVSLPGDLWFREGPRTAEVLPEPSTIFFVAATLLGWVGVSVLRTIL